MRIALAKLTLGLLTAAASAAEVDTPEALVAAIYDQYRAGVEYPDGDFIRAQQSTRLNALFDADAAQAGDEIGRIDFDPYINGQDYDISGLVIHPAYLAGGRAVVNVTFANFGAPQDLGIMLVKEGPDWKVDDVWTTNPDFSYDLLDLLTAPLNSGAADGGAE